MSTDKFYHLKLKLSKAKQELQAGLATEAVTRDRIWQLLLQYELDPTNFDLDAYVNEPDLRKHVGYFLITDKNICYMSMEEKTFFQFYEQQLTTKNASSTALRG